MKNLEADLLRKKRSQSPFSLTQQVKRKFEIDFGLKQIRYKNQKG